MTRTSTSLASFYAIRAESFRFDAMVRTAASKSSSEALSETNTYRNIDGGCIFLPVHDLDTREEELPCEP